MHLVAIAWLYVAVMMALAEATHAQGSVLGALVTFLLYGLAPVALVMYLLGTPARWRARKRGEARTAATAPAATDAPPASAPRLDPDGSGHAPAVPVQPGVAPE